MPLNTLRLNYQASSHPNERIVFIKPLPRPNSQQADHDLADTFLRAIAAQCLPIMKGHYLSVTTLEEYEPNPEFVGRNFNNGEIIQLVLRSKSGAWLPFNMVQMVMMHELAHNTHMNHGKYFWQTRNLYSQQMRELWAKRYTGEGFWGSGRTLGEVEDVIRNNLVPSEEIQGLPLCGGTYRSRRRKRKATKNGEELTWREKRDRRIEKKFGKNGTTLGEDEDRRLMLEINRKGNVGGKPRVAQSKRGRELRAAAALARFETNKRETKELKNQEDLDTDETEEDYEEADEELEDAKDLNGNRLLDGQGRGMIRVCDDQDQDEDDINVKQEMTELEKYLYQIPSKHGSNIEVDNESESDHKRANGFTGSLLPTLTTHIESNHQNHSKKDTKPVETSQSSDDRLEPSATKLSTPISKTLPDSASSSSDQSCPICSMLNDKFSTTCTACSHVLDRRKDPKHWKCSSQICQDSLYLNAGDVSICGVCGMKKDM